LHETFLAEGAGEEGDDVLGGFGAEERDLVAAAVTADLVEVGRVAFAVGAA
jgi:hypothetical protein